MKTPRNLCVSFLLSVVLLLVGSGLPALAEVGVAVETNRKFGGTGEEETTALTAFKQEVVTAIQKSLQGELLRNAKAAFVLEDKVPAKPSHRLLYRENVTISKLGTQEKKSSGNVMRDGVEWHSLKPFLVVGSIAVSVRDDAHLVARLGE